MKCTNLGQHCSWTACDGTSVGIWMSDHLGWVALLEARQTQVSKDKTPETEGDKQSDRQLPCGTERVRVGSTRFDTNLRKIQKN